MAIQKTDRDQVIHSALTLFRVQGYHNTSMADISGACGLLKGSIYHYFPSKKALALAALDRVIAEGEEKLFTAAADATVPAWKRLGALAAAIEQYFIGREGGCLMGNLALELGGSVPEFAQRIRRYFGCWEAALSRLLATRYGPERAAELAQDAIARVQGAIMMMGIHKDAAVLRRAGRDVIALLADAAPNGMPAAHEREEVRL